MRPKLHRAALARFAVGLGVAAAVPVGVVAAAGLSAIPVAMAVGVGGVAALLSAQQLRRSRPRVTRSRRA